MENNSEKEPLDLLLEGDRMRVRCIYLSLLSIVRRTTRPLRVHIFSMTVKELGKHGEAITQEDCKLIQDMLLKHVSGSSVTLHDVTDRYLATIYKGKNNKSQYSPYSMIRLFADEVLPTCHRLIYLDDDTMGCSDIQEFEKNNISSLEMGVVVDWLAHLWTHTDYFNSGVLYINLDKVRETGLFRNALNMCCVKFMQMPDQSALNKLIRFKLIMPRRFNDQRKIMKDTVIAHYPKRLFGHFHPVKPWNIKRMHSTLHIHYFDEDYKEYIACFPFEKYGLETPSLD
jgi:lipopolysaccharide biosynthesis glycosyltransferase